MNQLLLPLFASCLKARTSAVATRSANWSAPRSRRNRLSRRTCRCRRAARWPNSLGVSRNTVFAAYSRLIDLGTADRGPRQIRLLRQPRPLFAESPDSGRPHRPDRPTCRKNSCARKRSRRRPQIPLDNPLDWRSYPYPFIYNQIDPDLFPVDDWRECARLALGRKNVDPCGPGDSVESDSPYLIEQLRQRLLGARGIVARSRRDPWSRSVPRMRCRFLARYLHSSTQPIAVEDPGFFGAFNAFRNGRQPHGRRAG